MNFRSFLNLALAGLLFLANPVFAGTDGALRGTVQDGDGVAIGGATVKILNSSGSLRERNSRFGNRGIHGFID